MDLIIPTFKFVSVTFALLAVGTGLQAIFDPVSFSKQFGLSLEVPNGKPDASHIKQHYLAKSYASLMGVRQLGTGITLLTFMYQGKWTEAATILAIIGIVVAGTDGFFIASAGYGAKGRFHAIPGAGIAALSAGAIYVGL